MEHLNQQVAQIAVQLQQEGKEPSLALVKARLGSVSMSPALLQAYQAWRNGVQSGQKTPSMPEQATVTPTETNSALQQDLARIEAKLDLIIKKLGL